MEARARALARFTWGGLAFVIAVILWGAFVRATGSGAGCGDHWPLCNGEMIPRAPAAQTIVELTHRITSGLALLFTLALVPWTFRVHPKRHPMRRGAVGSLVFMVLEGAIGAGLVLFKLVAENESMARAYAMSAHLVNTFLLLVALTLTAGYSLGEARPRVQGKLAWSYGAAFFGMIVLGVSGAITALGDTLFPATGLIEGLSPTAHVFLQLRIFHPLLAVVVGLMAVGAAWMGANRRPSPELRKYAIALSALFVTQMIAGGINVLLHAPVWMQLVHLLLADLVWIALIRSGSFAFSGAPVSERTSAATLPVAG